MEMEARLVYDLTPVRIGDELYIKVTSPAMYKLLVMSAKRALAHRRYVRKVAHETKPSINARRIVETELIIPEDWHRQYFSPPVVRPNEPVIDSMLGPY